MKLLSLFAVCVLFCSCQKNKQNESREMMARVHTKDSLITQLSELQTQGYFNGVGVAIADSSGTLLSRGFGFHDVQAKTAYTPQTVQTIGSVSKTFIGLALLKAQELGKLNLDDDASAYLPFALRNPNHPHDKITIRHIATHTSGINDTDAYLQHNYILYGNEKGKYNGDEYMNPPSAALSMPDFLKEVLVKGGKFNSNDVWGNYTPGSKYAYSNFGAATAALIIEKATGQSYGRFVEQYILQPLKMSHTHFNNNQAVAKSMSVLYMDSVTAIKPYHLITYPDGGLASSPQDMGRYLTELINGYKGKGTLLTAESYREYFKQYLSESQFSAPRSTKNPYSDEYNSGLFIAHTPAGFIGHTGGDPGVASLLYFNPKTGKGAYMVVNTGINSKPGMKCFYNMYDLLIKYTEKL